MNSKWPLLFLGLPLVVSGCMTMLTARQAQQSAAAAGCGVVAEPSATIDLTGYSLRELVEFAMTNRPSMVSAALAVADARLALKAIAADAPLVSYSPWTSPHLSVSGGYSATSDADRHLRWQTEGSASAGLSLDILVYDFGRNRARAREQVENVIAAECAFVQEGYAVFNDVATAYFNVLEQDALLEVAQTNETEYALHLSQAEDRLAAGEVQKLDVTRAKLDLSKAREVTIAASNQVVITGAELMRALGVDASRGTREEVFPATGRALSDVTRGFPTTRYQISEAFGLARTNAPVMAVARARLRAASHGVDYAIADMMPSVSAEIGINWADPLWVWHWGVSAAQSVFTGYRKTAAVERSVVALRAAEASVHEAEQRLSLDLETAIAVRDDALKALDTARVSVRAARENLDTVKAQYFEGDASRVDFTDSVSDFATALGSRVSAFYRGQIAEAKLFSLIGRVPEYDEGTQNEK